MKIANYAGRAVLIRNDQVIDIEKASAGKFGPDLMSIYERWSEFVAAASSFSLTDGEALIESKLLSPIPAPRQVFGIGLNYHSHAKEAGVGAPAIPPVFTKYPSSLSGPFANIPRSGETVDWEAEVVVVIGKSARNVSEADAWSHVAGLSVGQDISARNVQFLAGGQFSLGKSYEGFGPIGPWLVTLDEVKDPDDLHITCKINGEVTQNESSKDMVFNVSQLINQISAVTTLWPGDIIFTGSPAGVGLFEQPSRYLQVGDVVETKVEGIGTIRNNVVAG
ncbi:MAG: fumarylacetoacetate hydrolase family protein [Acidimicrobiaceae bacterium]